MNNKIKEKRLEKNMTLQQVGDLVGVGRSTVRKWENGMIENMRRDNVVKLSKALNISPLEILGLDEKDMAPDDLTDIYNQLEPKRQQKVYNYAQHELSEQNGTIFLDDYKEIYIQSKVSAGTGIVDLEPSHAESFSYNGKLPNNYDLAFQVEGNSMEPMFKDGEIIFVENLPEPVNGALMVVEIDDNAYIKKVYIEKDCLRLVSLNKDYKDIVADKENEIRIVGKVIF